MDNNTRNCKECQVSKPLDDFEKTTKDGKCRRAVCKPCYARKKATKAKEASAKVDRSSVPKPSACVECGKGPDVVDFKWRTDVMQGGWRTQCNECFNAKGYYKDYRVREREKDETAYLERNAAVHLAWVRQNPDKVKEQQAKTATIDARKVKTIKTSATQRGVVFEDADAEAMKSKLTNACHYCNFVPKQSEPLNGLNRVVPALGYTDANTVPCCATCNAIKGPLHVDEFITNIRAIQAYCRPAMSSAPRRRLPPFSGSAEKREADKVDKTDKLPDSVKVRMWSQACYLCGHGPAFGIDRVDPRKGYTQDNIRPCCSTHCNYMKKDMDLDDFLQHIAYVNAHTAFWVIGDTADLPLVTYGTLVREPVSILDDNGMSMMIFPSFMTAAKCFMGDAESIRHASAEMCLYRGHRWKRASRKDFETHRVNSILAENIIKSLTL